MASAMPVTNIGDIESKGLQDNRQLSQFYLKLSKINNRIANIVARLGIDLLDVNIVTKGDKFTCGKTPNTPTYTYFLSNSAFFKIEVTKSSVTEKDDFGLEVVKHVRTIKRGEEVIATAKSPLSNNAEGKVAQAARAKLLPEYLKSVAEQFKASLTGDKVEEVFNNFLKRYSYYSGTLEDINVFRTTEHLSRVQYGNLYLSNRGNPDLDDNTLKQTTIKNLITILTSDITQLTVDDLEKISSAISTAPYKPSFSS